LEARALTVRETLKLLGDVFPKGAVKLSPPDKPLEILYRVPLSDVGRQDVTAINVMKITETQWGWERSWDALELDEWTAQVSCEWGLITYDAANGTLTDYAVLDTFLTDNMEDLIAWVSFLRGKIKGDDAYDITSDRGKLWNLPNCHELAWCCPQGSNALIRDISLQGFTFIRPRMNPMLIRFPRPGISLYGYFADPAVPDWPEPRIPRGIVAEVEAAAAAFLDEKGLDSPTVTPLGFPMGPANVPVQPRPHEPAEQAGAKTAGEQIQQQFKSCPRNIRAIAMSPRTMADYQNAEPFTGSLPEYRPTIFMGYPLIVEPHLPDGQVLVLFDEDHKVLSRINYHIAARKGDRPGVLRVEVNLANYQAVQSALCDTGPVSVKDVPVRAFAALTDVEVRIVFTDGSFQRTIL
jgi:hypothetical protein